MKEAGAPRDAQNMHSKAREEEFCNRTSLITETFFYIKLKG